MPRNDTDRKRPQRAETGAEYYELHTQAVKDLAEASVENTPHYSEEELNRYRGKSRIRLPGAVKALLVKLWFNGAACFFFLWGLGFYVRDTLDILVILGIAMGALTDLLTNNALRFIAKTKGGNDRFIMVTKRGVAGFFLNILYAFVVLAFVYMIYGTINLAAVRLTGSAEQVALGVEPVLFGVFYQIGRASCRERV